MLPLALFSDKLAVDDRRALADTILQNKPANQPLQFPQLRFGTGFGKPTFPVLTPTTRLADLANKYCWFGMYQINIDPAFLQLPVENWDGNEAFQAGKAKASSINVVNDCAECGVKLTSDFVEAARTERHLQNVLKTVEHDRAKTPNLRFSKWTVDNS